ncbi:MAG: hypothetical protein HY909_19720 [Deltaproteobacteria bacterium]|nr:hypothetical protein [Deltaproteobacteria bacterium]
MRNPSLLAALLVSWSAGGVAWAQQDPAFEATRRELITRAQQAAVRGDHAEALALATRAGSLRMSPPLRRMVAEEERAVGRLAEALGSAQRCVAEVTEDAGLLGRAQHLAACSALVTDLERRVGRLLVRPPSPAPAGLELRIGEQVLAPALWGFPTVVTPGSVTLEARCPACRPWRQEVQVSAGSTVPVDVTPEALPPPPPPPPPPPTVCEGGRVSPAPGHCCWPGQGLSAGSLCEGPPRCPEGLFADGTECRARSANLLPPTQPSTGPQALRWVAVGAFVGAGLGLGLGVVGALVRGSALSAFNEGPEGCWRDPRDGGIWAERPENVRACADTAERFSLGGTLATVGFTAGGVLAAASMALWLAVPSQRGERRAALRCGTGPGDLGLSCAVGF